MMMVAAVVMVVVMMLVLMMVIVMTDPHGLGRGRLRSEHPITIMDHRAVVVAV